MEQSGTTIEDSAELRQIVGEVDRVPLALELAAGRLNLMSPAQLLRRMSKRLELLKKRDRTLRGAIDLSWDMLSDVERAAFAQCAVFAGGFTADAAEAVIDVDGDALDALQSLRDRSLLHATPTPDGMLRLGMYRSIRDYAVARLDDDAAEARAAQKRHATAFAAFADQLRDKHTAAVRRSLILEYDNMRVAFERTIDSDVETALRLLLALDGVWHAVGPLEARLQLLDRAVDEIEEAGAPDDLHARVRKARAHALRRRGTNAAGWADCRRALELAHDDRLVGEVLVDIGVQHHLDGQIDEAVASIERAIDALIAADAPSAEAIARVQLAYVLIERRRVVDALSQTSLALRAGRAAGDARSEGVAEFCSGLVHQDSGDLPRAAEAYQRALVLLEPLDEKAYMSSCFCQLGVVRQEQRRLEQAADNLQRALALGALDAWVQALSLAHLAGVEALAGQQDAAARHIAGADAVLHGNDVPHLALACELQRALVDPTLAGAVIKNATAALPATMDVRVSLRILSAHRTTSDKALVVQQEGLWFRLPAGEVVSCRRRKMPTRRLLSTLAERRISAPGDPISAKELLTVCWPDERMIEESGLNRLYVTVNGLRKMGLRDLLVAGADGYMFDPHQSLKIVAQRTPRSVL